MVALPGDRSCRFQILRTQAIGSYVRYPTCVLSTKLSRARLGFADETTMDCNTNDTVFIIATGAVQVSCTAVGMHQPMQNAIVYQHTVIVLGRVLGCAYSKHASTLLH